MIHLHIFSTSFSRVWLKSYFSWFIEFEGLKNEVKVKVVREKTKKPFLGGFRHRLTGVEYHNASAQTVPKKRLPPSVCHYHFFL